MRTTAIRLLQLSLACVTLVAGVAGQVAFASPYADAVLADSPVGYWRFGESKSLLAADASGNALTGTYHGVTLGIPGAIGQDPNTALSTGNEGGYIQLPANPLLNQLTNNFTLEAWVNPSDLSGIANIFSNRKLVGDAGGYGFSRNGGHLGFSFWGIEGFQTTNTVLQTDEWQLINVVIQANNEVWFYVNGEAVEFFTGSHPVNPNDQGLYIGIAADSWGAPEPWRGGLDEVAVYNHALTAEQIAHHFEIGAVPEQPGDANRDGLIDGADYTIWADNFLKTGQTWRTGDFNGDGVVDGADYTIWADNFSPAQLSPTAVPEPSTLALGGVGALALAVAAVRRRRASCA